MAKKLTAEQLAISHWLYSQATAFAAAMIYAPPRSAPSVNRGIQPS